MTIPEYLKKHNLTQEQFGTMIGKSQQLVSGYCTGQLVPPRATALKIITVSKGEITLEDLWHTKIA